MTNLYPRAGQVVPGALASARHCTPTTHLRHSAGPEILPAAVTAAITIPQMAPLAFEQIIIAGGDDDVSAVELFDWVSPLLAGIPGGRWMSCQFDIAEDGGVLAHYRHGASDMAVFITLDPQAPMTRDLLQQLPDAQSVTMILLSDFSSQAVMLLDSVARWLSIYDIDEDSIAPVVQLLGGFQDILAKAV